MMIRRLWSRLSKPSEEDLVELGISETTYIENDFFVMKLAGMCRWTKAYSFYYFGGMFWGLVSFGSFIYFGWLAGKKAAVLEIIYYIPIVLNMISEAAAYHYTYKEFKAVFRAIDRGGFNYEGTLDEETEEEIKKMREDTRRRKMKFGRFITGVVLFNYVGGITKRPVSSGEGTGVSANEYLIMDGTYGMYVPFGDYWIVYILAMFLHYSCVTFAHFTSIGSMNTYQYMAEELLLEFAVVNLTLKKCVQRAEFLCSARKDGVSEEKSSQSQDGSMEKCINHCLNLSIKHHLEALTTFDVLKRLLHFPLFMVIFDGSICLCVCVYLLLSEDTTLEQKQALPALIIGSAILILLKCTYGEQLSQSNEAIGNSIYDCEKWTEHSRLIKPYALILKSFCSVPNKLSAGGFTTVDHVCFGNVMSTTYTYMNYLFNMAQMKPDSEPS